MSKSQETIGDAIEYAYAGDVLREAPEGLVWVQENNPHAGNMEPDWRWALYKKANA